MKVVKDDIWVCPDCLQAAVNGDLSGLDNDPETADARAKAINEGLAAFGPHLVPDFDTESGEGISEFSRRSCDGCGDHHHGGRHRFAVLGED